MNTTHIAASTSLTMNCEHCRMTQSTIPGATLDRLADSVRGFLIMHRRCEKPVEPSKQVELFDELAAKEPVLPGRASDMLRELEEDDKPYACCCGARFGETWERVTHWETCAKFLGKSIDGNSDEPDPETDPPGALGIFERMFPMPRDNTHLHHLLRSVVPEAQRTQLAAWLATWPIDSGLPAFDEIAHWARTEQARIDAQGRAQRGEPGIPGLYIPTARMPLCLSDALGLTKKKRGARPLTSGKRRKANDAQS
jgi:hypothetical protein